jgi:uncharacterized membrane protein (UPF0127 family)
MRFELDVCFLGEGNQLLAVWREIPARRIISCRGARSVLEIPAGQGGEFSLLGT